MENLETAVCRVGSFLHDDVEVSIVDAKLFPGEYNEREVRVLCGLLDTEDIKEKLNSDILNKIEDVSTLAQIEKGLRAEDVKVKAAIPMFVIADYEVFADILEINEGANIGEGSHIRTFRKREVFSDEFTKAILLFVVSMIEILRGRKNAISVHLQMVRSGAVPDKEGDESKISDMLHQAESGLESAYHIFRRVLKSIGIENINAEELLPMEIIMGPLDRYMQ